MSYVDHCKKHGQYHGEICGECFEDLKVENTRLRAALEKIIYKCYLCDKGFKSFPCSCGKYGTIEEIVREALEDK